MPDVYDWGVAVAGLARLLNGISAAFVFLDYAGVGPLPAVFTDSFEDLADRHDLGGGESSGGKMPPGQ